MRRLAQRARKEKLPSITAGMVTEAIYTFKDATGQGLDRIGPRMLKHLPEPAHADIADLLNECERLGTWPWQPLCSLIVLLGKPGGGERPIGLLCMLLRLYARVRRPQTRSWSAKWAEHWDDAVRGSSSLRSALLQRLRIEMRWRR